MLRFTVIIVTRNRAAFLAETLVALGGLSYHGSWEALVVDNGSTDHTRAIVHRLAETFPVRLRYLSEPAGGKYSGLNVGIRAADGACIAATDDDAFPVADWLEHAHTALVADGTTSPADRSTLSGAAGGRAGSTPNPRPSPRFSGCRIMGPSLASTALMASPGRSG